MAHTEADRQAFYKGQSISEEQAKANNWECRIQIWLDDNPQIGRTVTNRFYIVVDDEVEYLTPLQVIK